MSILKSPKAKRRFIDSHKMNINNNTYIGVDLNTVSNRKSLSDLVIENQHFCCRNGLVYFNKSDLTKSLLFWLTNK